MKNSSFLVVSFFCVIVSFNLNAQYCKNNIDTIYGLNSITSGGAGQIVGINVNNAGTKPIGSPATGSANANGLGYCSVDGRFYFFNQVGGGVTEFVSFNPTTGTKVSLAIPSSPALPTASTGKIRSGTINQSGTGYYFIFPGATTTMGYPKTAAALYYYSIGTNTWKLITQKFVDKTAAVVTDITSLNSGDMAFDGDGNLWILSSNSSSYALYKIAAPIPTTSVASILLDIKVPTTATPGGVSFTGIAFNSSGRLYLSSGSYTTAPGTAYNNKLYQLSTISSSLTVIGTLPNGYGDDLTSCTFPNSVLAGSFIQFDAHPLDGKAKLNWEVVEDGNESGYSVEYGTSISQLKPIAFITKKHTGTNETAAYSFLHNGINTGYHYYRVKKITAASPQVNSDIKRVTMGNTNKIFISPNPASEFIQINNINHAAHYVVKIYDCSGKLMNTKNLECGNRSVNISQLKKGMYILHLLPVDNNGDVQSFRFVKF